MDITSAHQPPRLASQRPCFSQPWAPRGRQFTLATMITIVTLFASGMGIFAADRGLGVSYFAVVVPASVATAIRNAYLQRNYGKLPLWDKMGFLLAATVTISGILLVLTLVGTVALFLYCLVELL